MAGFRQDVAEQHPIPVGPENGFAPVAAIQNVIDRARIFDSEFSGHGAQFEPEKTKGQ